MFSLMLALLLCVLVPWLSVLVWQWVPRRPADPPAAANVHRLAAELRRSLLHEDPAEAEPRADITRLREIAPHAARSGPAGPAEDGEPMRGPETDVPATEQTEPLPLPQVDLGSYWWLHRLERPFFILGFLSLGVGWAVLLDYLGEEHAKTFQPAVFLLKPSPYWLICGLPAFVLGVFTVLPVFLLLVYVCLGRRRFLDYAFWDEGLLANQGSSMEGLLRWLSQVGILLGALCAGFVFQVMNWHARFSEKEVAVRRMWEFGEEIHRYDDVTHVVVSSHRKVDKEIVPGENLALRFRDGRTWSSADGLRMPAQPQERKRLLGFLQQKTGRPVTRVRLPEDLPAR